MAEEREARRGLKRLVDEWRHWRRQRFVILFHPRSGSSWLRSILAANPNFEMGFELLGDVKEPARQEEVVREFLGERYRFKKIDAVGFKLGGYQVRDPEAIRRQLKDQNAKIIVLTRKNLLKVAVSQIRRGELARETEKALGKRLQNRVDGVAPPPPSQIAPNKLVATMRQAEKAREQTEELAAYLGRPVLSLNYEQLLEDLDRVLDKAEKFLGVPIKVRDRYTPRKNTPDDLKAAVANLDEIASVLRNGEYAEYAPSA